MTEKMTIVWLIVGLILSATLTVFFSFHARPRTIRVKQEEGQGRGRTLQDLRRNRRDRAGCQPAHERGIVRYLAQLPLQELRRVQKEILRSRRKEAQRDHGELQGTRTQD